MAKATNNKAKKMAAKAAEAARIERLLSATDEEIFAGFAALAPTGAGKAACFEALKK